MIVAMDERIKILYVDDEPINLLLFKCMFENKYDVETAESGMKGLDILNRNPSVRVVITDMRMPQMDGIQFISKAKGLYPGIYFYMLSGYDITADIQEALSNGLILKYFQKPFKMEEIDYAIGADMGNE
jgi:two-component system response regulator (stage 0 sporulation protein F)